MKRASLYAFTRAGLFASCIFACMPAAAVVVGTRPLDTDPNGNAVNALMNGFRFYADGLSARFIDRANQGIAPATERTWRAFEERLTASTFVTLFYSYQGNDGVSRSRTYYAMSGSRGKVEMGPEPLLTPDLAEWLDPWPGEVMATAQDASTSRVPWQVPTVRPDATWDLQDAELKAVRTLEKDLQDHVVEKAGVATVFISGASCIACSQALNNFANAYELSLVGNENSVPYSQTNQLFRARQSAYLATVRSSLVGRERFRPANAPPARGQVPAMCVVGRPVVTFPVAIRPPTISTLVTLIRAYARTDDSAAYILSGDAATNDEDYARWVLVDPSSPYSAFADRDLSPMNDAVRLAAQWLTVDGRAPTHRELSRNKQRELGFTKSRPWVDVPDIYGAPINTYTGVPSHTKAGVSAETMLAVRDMVGNDYPAIGALYAVAAQLLREKLHATTAAEQRRLGLRADVLAGMTSQPRTWRPSDFDRRYLAILLDGEMRDWNLRTPYRPDVAPLPVALRIARVAGAYRDQQPYEVEPCLDATRHNPVTAGKGGDDTRPLCFNDATDRAVYGWFVAELRREMANNQPSEIGDPHRRRMTDPFRYTQFDQRSPGRPALGAAIRKEVVEMKIVNRLVVDGDLSYEASQPVIQRAVKYLYPAKNHLQP